MKKVILALCLLAINFAIAPKGMAQADRLASFVGGEEALKDYIAKNANFPQEAMGNKPINGRVYVLAEVQEDGSLDKIKVVRKLDPILDESAIRLAQNMPKWLPQMRGDKGVRSTVRMTIKFVLDPRLKEAIAKQKVQDIKRLVEELKYKKR